MTTTIDVESNIALANERRDPHSSKSIEYASLRLVEFYHPNKFLVPMRSVDTVLDWKHYIHALDWFADDPKIK